MAWRSCKISAPGSVMILGEHAVLHGSRAIVCAVNHRMTFTAKPLDRPVLTIQSALGEYESPINGLKEDHTFRFVLEALQGLSSDQGIDLIIQSDMSDQVGLGTSAAVAACACALRAHIENTDSDPVSVLKKTVQVIRAVQGSGSGSDAAASVFGGCVVYNQNSLATDPLTLDSELALIYAGYKTPTPEVLRIVNAWAEEHPEEADAVYSDMQTLVKQATQNPSALPALAAEYQQCMERLGVCDEALRDILNQLSQNPKVQAAKISGSGLGDCVIAFGDAQAAVDGYTSIPIDIELKGLTIESI